MDDNVHKAEVKNCIQLLRQLQGNVSVAEKVQAYKRKAFFLCVCVFLKKVKNKGVLEGSGSHTSW